MSRQAKNYTLKVSNRQQPRCVKQRSTWPRTGEERMKWKLCWNKFDIMAPASGMVIYKKDWNGQKRTAGTEINTWDLTVATLPDLSDHDLNDLCE